MKVSLRTFNNYLSVLVIALGLYLVATPFIPQFSFFLRDKSPEVVAPYSGKLASATGSGSSASPPLENRIVIPSIGVNEQIYEGSSIGVINNGGTWRRPNTARPPESDNTVIVGHRFFGDNVSTFYHLDKVEKGQYISVYWEGEEHFYQVTDKKIVDSARVEIENGTNSKQLTIYTCDPIWTATNRLVIIAKPVEIES